MARWHGVARFAPVVVAVVWTAYSLHRMEVGTRDLAVYGVYIALGLVLPGTVLWRLLVTRGRSSPLFDVACGISLAWAVELGVYALAAHIGAPQVAFLWPILPVAASLVPLLRARVWRRGQHASPWWLSTWLSGLVVFMVTVLTRNAWAHYRLTGAGLRYPYVDVIYHLSLISALKRGVPVGLPSVEGQPMYYHWFFHAAQAAASHATGIEPVVLLTRLAPLVLAVAVLIGVAALTYHLTGSSVTAGTAATLLTCAAGTSLSINGGQLFTSVLLFLSPTTVFAEAMLVGVIGVSVILLDADGPRPWTAWIAAIALVFAASGAKGSLPSVLMCGYVAVVLMTLLLRRRVDRHEVGLLLLGVVAFVLAQRFVYGGSTQGTDVSPLAFGRRVAVHAHLESTLAAVPLWLALASSVVYVVVKLNVWGGVSGLFVRHRRSDPRAHFLVGTVVAAIGAFVILRNASLNQVYFLLVIPPAAVVSSSWGVHTLAASVARHAATRLVTLSVVVGAAVGFVCRSMAAGSSGRPLSVWTWFLPAVVALTAVVLTGVAAPWVAGRSRQGRTRTLAAATVVMALGLPWFLSETWTIVTTPSRQFSFSPVRGPATIGPGGVAAARWLRDHSSARDVVATNVHCRVVTAPSCDHRTTWVAGFTERQVLLEGWAYTSDSAKYAAQQHRPVPYVAYWKPQVLRANDSAFTRPTEQRIDTLLRRFGVRWLFVDKRFPVNLPRLKRVARLELDRLYYAVFRIG
ncbi:MAG: hypothetical protein M3Z50_08410 [Actinomycetota bacterium]|nr:hypothetical protein [Actinomycetota bacterium]